MSYNIDVRLRLPALLLSLFAVFTATTAHAHSEPWVPGNSPARVGAFTGVTPQNRIGGYQLASLLSEADLQLQLGGSTRANWLSITAHASGSGLFQQRDPSGFADSVNLYAGFAWDPVNKRDPTGMSTHVISQAQVAAAQRRVRSFRNNLPAIRRQLNEQKHACANARVKAGSSTLTHRASAHCDRIWSTTLPSEEQLGQLINQLDTSVGGMATSRLWQANQTMVADLVAFQLLVASTAVDPIGTAVSVGSGEAAASAGAGPGAQLLLSAIAGGLYGAARTAVAVGRAPTVGAPLTGEGGALSIVDEVGAVGFADEGFETLYRAMSEKEYRAVLAQQGLQRRPTGASELGVVADEAYALSLVERARGARKYPVVVEFKVRKGTLDRLVSSGATHNSAAGAFPDLPQFEPGIGRPQVKFERGGVLSVLLGHSEGAVSDFNSAIIGIGRIR